MGDVTSLEGRKAQDWAKGVWSILKTHFGSDELADIATKNAIERACADPSFKLTMNDAKKDAAVIIKAAEGK